MTQTFVLDNETVLCHSSCNGWSPISVNLPTVDTARMTANDQIQPIYQLGCVSLFESMALCDAQDTSLSIAREKSIPATYAVTRHYAKTHNMALPTITPEPITEKSINIDKVAFIPYRQLVTQLPIAVAAQLSQAIQLLRWQADTQFCSRCGDKVTIAQLGERAMVCQSCELRQYPRVQPCVITAITRPNPLTGEMQILLAHHHRYGRQTLPLQYGLIAGFVEVGESLEHAVVREVDEEVGIRLTDISYVSSQPWPFPSNLMLGFRASYAGGEIVLQEDELSHADFFNLSDLPKIPFKGSIAYHLIAQIAHEQGITL